MDIETPLGLVGGIGLTEVHVYGQRVAPDGQWSGSPHVHAVTDEGYFILRGSGAVEFHDVVHGYRRLPLTQGQYVHFPPLVMHRLISDHGGSDGLVVLGIMGNAGLAERGEARIYFGEAVDADPVEFDRLCALPRTNGLEGALQRRDTAVSAYMRLMELWSTDRARYSSDLRRYIAAHCAAMARIAPDLLQRVQAGPMAWAHATGSRITTLPNVPEVSPLVVESRPTAPQALGMCGVLRTVIQLNEISSTPPRLPQD